MTLSGARSTPGRRVELSTAGRGRAGDRGPGARGLARAPLSSRPGRDPAVGRSRPGAGARGSVDPGPGHALGPRLTPAAPAAAWRGTSQLGRLRRHGRRAASGRSHLRHCARCSVGPDAGWAIAPVAHVRVGPPGAPRRPWRITPCCGASSRARRSLSRFHDGTRFGVAGASVRSSVCRFVSAPILHGPRRRPPEVTWAAGFSEQGPAPAAPAPAALRCSSAHPRRAPSGGQSGETPVRATRDRPPAPRRWRRRRRRRRPWRRRCRRRRRRRRRRSAPGPRRCRRWRAGSGRPRGRR